MTYVCMEVVADSVEPPAPGVEENAPAQERVQRDSKIAKSKNKQTKSRDSWLTLDRD